MILVEIWLCCDLRDVERDYCVFVNTNGIAIFWVKLIGLDHTIRPIAMCVYDDGIDYRFCVENMALRLTFGHCDEDDNSLASRAYFYSCC